MATFLTHADTEISALRSQLDLAAEQPNVRLRRLLASGDVVAGMLAFTLPLLIPGSLLANAIEAQSAGQLIAPAAGIVVFGALTLFAMAVHRLYRARVSSMRTVEISRIGQASFILGIAAVVLGRLAGEIHMVRFPVLVALGAFFFLNVWRAAYTTWLNNARRNDRFTRSVILVGANDEAFTLYRHLGRHPELGYRIRGVVGSMEDVSTHNYDVPWLGEIWELEGVLTQTGLKGAIVAGSGVSRPELNVAVRQLLKHQVHVHMSTGINGIDHRRMQSHALAYEPMVYVERAQLEGWQVIVKRAIDIVVSATVLILVAPIMAITALLVKLHDRGPVLFRQERVGRDGNHFTMIKFRSMCMDAETRLVDLSDDNMREGPLFKLEVDPRVTPIGRIIRATSVDELPQLINVLRGHMSLVGPRPALPSEVEKFDDALLARHDVRPGITGLWQVEARDNPDFAIYQRLDIFYVENWSVALDLSILLGTAKVVVLHALAAIRRARIRRIYRSTFKAHA